MNCTRCRSLFDPAHEGSLEPGSPLRAEFDEHLSSCPGCSEGWSQWQEAMGALRGLAAGRASPQETEAVMRAVEHAVQRPASSALEPEPERDAAFRHGLLLAAAQNEAGRRRRVAAVLVAAASGALAASLVFVLWSPRAETPPAGTAGSPSPPVASAPSGAPAEPRPIVIDTRPLAEVLAALGERVHQQLQLLARGEAQERPESPGTASSAAPALSPVAPPVPAVASFVPLPGEVLVSRDDGQLSLTLAAASPEEVPDFRALVPPLLQLLSAADEEVARLAEARLESVRSQVEELTGPVAALAGDALRDDRRRDASGWRRLLGLPRAEAPDASAGARWHTWWEAVEPLLPDLGGAT